ncbi:MAG: SDR family NAD(P)-dependent oxidoreductase [bacterium]|nr:SDR family NAD(P)-dependent oxidoreductase [bacterium]
MKDPKSILITGGSSGIGQGLLLSYAREGVTLAFNGRDEKRVAEVAKLLEGKGARVFPKVIDVRDADGMKKWIEDIDAQAPLDLVIANAGVSPRAEMSLDERAKLIFDINVYGVFNTIHPAIDLMKKRGRGQIAIVSSLAGYMGLPKSPSYSSSKAAVKAYGRGLRSTLARDGIQVAVICPGWVPSRITDQHKDEIPFFVSVDYAVRRIRRGLERNAGLIPFPPSLTFLVWLFSTWPDWMHDFVFGRMKY